jgi:imidazolonepropionase-like amidohydrolase
MKRPAPLARVLAVAIAVVASTAGSPRAAPSAVRAEADLAAARAVFRANLDAIRRRDRDAYLACYLKSDHLARTASTGFLLGYDSLAASAGSGWPDLFEGLDLRLVPVRDGVVYGTYRYRVRYGDDEQTGISERLFVETPQGWRIAVTSAFPALSGTPPPPRVLLGATLVDGTGRPPVRDAVVVLREGKVECAGPRSRCRVPAGVDTLDARGLWVTPGLVDAHVHYSQTGWVDGRPDAADLRDLHPYEEVERRLRLEPERFHRSALACGVTAVFDVGGFPWTVGMQAPSDRDTRSPHVRAAGPLLTTIDHWLNLPAERQFIYLASDSVARAGVRYLKSLGSAAVKVWFIVPPQADFGAMERAVMAAGEEARAAGLPLIVHATGLREAKAALRAGAALLVHSVWDVPVDREFLDLAKRQGTLYCPTLTVIDGYRRLYEAAREGHAPAVDDPNRAVDSLTLARVSGDLRQVAERMRGSDPKRQAEFHRVMALNLIQVKRAGIPIVMGTDAGNPLTLHGPAVYTEMEAMRAAGMTPMEVLVAATRNGARAMGESRRFGTVEPGKDADLVILGADPTRDVRAWRQVRYVVRGGVVRGIEELRAR